MAGPGAIMLAARAEKGKRRSCGCREARSREQVPQQQEGWEEKAGCKGWKELRGAQRGLSSALSHSVGSPGHNGFVQGKELCLNNCFCLLFFPPS